MEKKQKMTRLTLVRSMFDGISSPVGEYEYRLLGIPKYSFLKRKKFSNTYKTLFLYLSKSSIPRAFPDDFENILLFFDEFYKIAYENHQRIKEGIDKDLEKFNELTDWQSKDESKFFKLSQHIVEQFEKGSNKTVFSLLLNNRINYLYKNFINIGKKVEIVKDDPEDKDILGELKKNI